MANTAKEKKKDTIKKQTTDSLPLMRNNFIIMIAAAVLIVGGSEGPEFNPAIFSNTRIVVGPMLAFVGFVLMGVGIIVRPRETKKD